MANGRASEFDEASADIPIWGWLSGASGRRDAARNAYDNQRAREAWENLAGGAPTADDLAVNYQGEGTTDEYGDMLGGASQLEGFGASDAQYEALRRLQGLADGGLTSADRQMMNAGMARNAQAMGSANRAALQRLEARGTGGSGAALAAQLSGSQSMANANMQMNAQVVNAAQQRALAALQGYTAQGNAMQGQDFARRQALDAYNQQQLDWRRGRGQRNTQWGNRSAESRADAAQDAYGNQERAVAGITGQYQAGADGRRADGARQDQQASDTAAGIGTLIAGIL